MKTIRIPASLEEARQQLIGLGELLTATEWERAAIVATFVRLDVSNGGPRELSKSGQFISAREFAEFGIVGLRSASTISRYVNAWTVFARLPHPKPGSRVKLPELEWPPEQANLGSRTSAGNVGDAIRMRPDIAAAAATALSDPDVPLPPRVTAGLASGARQRKQEMEQRARAEWAPPTAGEQLDRDWTSWLSALDRLLTQGAELAERSERTETVLGVHAVMAKMVYERILERKIDAEIRNFFDREGVQ